MEQDLLSTPPSKRIAELTVPNPPSKKYRLRSLNITNTLNISPSVVSKSMHVEIKSNSKSITPQTFNMADENSSDTTDNEDDIFSAAEHRLSSPFSDDASRSYLSLCDDTNKWFNNSNIADVTLALNKLIPDTLKTQSSYKQIKKPCHRFQNPKKSILVIPQEGLNLIVRSSKGSLEDATIYATEINASLSRKDFNLPLISNTDEVVTIPVNASIRQKYKRYKRAYLNKFGQIDDSDFEEEASGNKSNDDLIPDAALIRGYSYDIGTSKHKISKTLASCNTLSWAAYIDIQ